MHLRLMRALALKISLGLVMAVTLAACGNDRLAEAPTSTPTVQNASGTPQSSYMIGPGDTLKVFVWRSPELSSEVRVRPDGGISLPLVDDMSTTGKTPSVLAKDIEGELKKYVQDPIVTVVVTDFVGPFDQQVRVVGEAVKPQALTYRSNMTVLDVVIAVGGLTPFGAGNRAVIVRKDGEEEKSFRVRLDDLVKDGDVSANVAMAPGDILIIPQSWF